MLDFCLFTVFENVSSMVKLDVSLLGCSDIKNIEPKILNNFTAQKYQSQNVIEIPTLVV